MVLFLGTGPPGPYCDGGCAYDEICRIAELQPQCDCPEFGPCYCPGPDYEPRCVPRYPKGD